MATGLTSISNLAPELPLQMSDDFLSTPSFNQIHSFGADLHYAEAHMGQNLRMSRFNPLSTDGGELDGSGLDPAPEIPVRTDVDAKVEIFAKSIVYNEQVSLFESSRVQAKFSMLLGQWLREKEDLLMRDLLASSPTYVNATGGVNGDQPTEASQQDVDNIERVLLGNDAQTMLQAIQATDQFGTGPAYDAMIALCNTDIIPDLKAMTDFVPKNQYPGAQQSYRPEEYGSMGRFRFFVSSKGIKVPSSSLLGADVYKIPMYGVEAFGKIEQNSYSSVIGYIPPEIASRVAQNAMLYAKFAIGRAIENQSWLSGLNVTQRL